MPYITQTTKDGYKFYYNTISSETDTVAIISETWVLWDLRILILHLKPSDVTFYVPIQPRCRLKRKGY